MPNLIKPAVNTELAISNSTQQHAIMKTTASFFVVGLPQEMCDFCFAGLGHDLCYVHRTDKGLADKGDTLISVSSLFSENVSPFGVAKLKGSRFLKELLICILPRVLFPTPVCSHCVFFSSLPSDVVVTAWCKIHPLPDLQYMSWASFPNYLSLPVKAGPEMSPCQVKS
ncbi:hypothetical protein JRQ81_016609 [Phrynocephalus forsythii]|uniref:Uncharacterized protein n=1 Tax=Phrynocephalus forsythii TaxID=171643 RepID=A0A9Q0XV36_9SAUR|nr:hypothetical protein JRQ81_016609 [Phrynocephalus forsythii]